VRTLPVTAAVTRLRAAGFAVVIAGERPSRRVAPGAVLEQTPSPGATILRGSEVALTLSRRPAAARP
jgi:beta-lactam-binding protein with PASTA domain